MGAMLASSLNFAMASSPSRYTSEAVARAFAKTSSSKTGGRAMHASSNTSSNPSSIVSISRIRLS